MLSIVLIVFFRSVPSCSSRCFRQCLCYYFYAAHTGNLWCMGKSLISVVWVALGRSTMLSCPFIINSRFGVPAINVKYEHSFTRYT